MGKEKRFKRKRQSGKPKSLWESVKEYKDQDQVQSQAWAKVTSLNYFVSSLDKFANLTLEANQSFYFSVIEIPYVVFSSIYL